MKKTLYALLLMLMAVSCASTRKTPAEKRAQAMRDSIEHVITLETLQSRRYMVTADKLSFSRGKTLHVYPSTNFLLVSGDSATYQIAPANGGGFNGVGGITVDGTVSNYKERFSAKGEAFITFTLLGSGCSVDVSINLPKQGKSATVRAQASLAKYSSTLYGDVMPLDPTQVVHGLSR